MITKDKILSDLNRSEQSQNNFDLIINELTCYFERFSNDIHFSEYSFSKNQLKLLLIKGISYNLHIELTNDFIQIQLYENSELLIYLENNSVIEDVKILINSVFTGKYKIVYYLDSSNKIISKKMVWNDENLSKYDKEYVFKLFSKEFSKTEIHKGLSFF